MRRFSVSSKLVSFAVFSLLGGSTVDAARADDRRCLEIEHPTTITSDKRCVRVTETVHGDVVNNATVGESNRERPGFFIGGDGLITGKLINNGTIKGGGDEWGALTLGKNADVQGGIFNNGTMVSGFGNAIQLGYLEDEHWSYPQRAALTGNIVNAGLFDGHDNGVAALYGTMSGALINQANGTIKGGDVGVLIADTFLRWTGGIENFGLIAGDDAGLQIGALNSAGYGVEFAGGISNGAGGKISAKSGPSVAIGGKSFAGGLTNAGLITQQLDEEDDASQYRGVGVVFAATTVSGGLLNEQSGVIEGLGGPAVWITQRTNSFAGGITNKGKIDGTTDGLLVEASNYFGGVVNTATGKILGGSGAALLIGGNSFAGGVENAGLIKGRSGVEFDASSVSGGLLNQAGAMIEGRDGPAISVNGTVTSFGGGIVNRGTIEGAHDGVVIKSAAFAGGLLNAASASILAHEGDAIFASAAWSGDFENRGAVKGADRGFAYDGSSFDGDAINAGSIKGGGVAFFLNAATFGGSFTNSGNIDGGTTGVSLVAGHVDGGFKNSGSIKGQTYRGVSIDAGSWGTSEARADIVNTASGEIKGGETGFWLRALSVFGDFINDGAISGGGSDTGIFFDVEDFFGDILNHGEVEAPSNAVYLNIGTLHGQVTNTGTITASGPNGVAVALDIGNGTIFTNESDGLIKGDVILGGQAAYMFVGHDGGVEGDIVGSGSDDRLIVSDGTQYFVDGILTDLLRFDVENGGIAVMGGRFIGDPDGPGYGATNVDALNVHEGGRLYLDNNSILHVGTFTQDVGGELTYLLVAPNSTPVAGTDFGRIDASGAVSLAGKLSVILDPSSFGGTTQTEFTYADIIRGSSLTGEFQDVEIEGSSYFFELALTYGDNAVNLEVTRTPFDVTFCAEHLSQNSSDLGAALESAFLAGGFTPEQIALFDFIGQLEDVCSGYFDLGGAVLGDIHAITVETAGPWKSAVNDRVNSTGATSCVVAGSGGCLTKFVQNEAGGSAVQTDASDPFAWLRTGVRPQDQFSVWGRILGVQGDNQGRGGARGSDFTVTGGIVGADYVVTPRFIVGAAAQLTNTDVDFKHRRDTADVRSFEVGGYFSYGDVDFCINGNASIIFHDFNTYRFPFDANAQGAYQGRTVSAYVEAGKVFEFDMLRVEPVLALSFASLDTDSYRETGTAGVLLLNVEGASHQSLKSMTGVRVAYPLDLLESGRKIVPEMRLLWGHEYLDDQAQFRAALASLPDHPFAVRGQRFSRESLLAGVGLNVPLSSQSVLYVDYDFSLSRDQSVQSLTLGARLSW